MSVFVRKPEALAGLDPTRSLVVEASAGTGKTFTIEHLVLDAILRGIPIEALLVITFTEKAASELIARLRRLLSEVPLLPTAPAAPHWRLEAAHLERLAAARAALPRARISTIHGFCQRMLAEHPFESRRPFVLDVVSERTVFDAGLRHHLEREVPLDPERSTWVRAWMSQRRLSALIEAMASIALLGARTHPDFDPARWAGAFTTLASRAGPRWSRAAAAAPVGGPAKARLRTRVTELIRWLRLEPEEALGRMPEALEETASQLGEVLEPEESSALRELLQASAPFDAAVASVLLPGVQARMRAIARELGVQTYADMVRGADEALEDRALRPLLRGGIELALVDEFQDTDPTQWRILERLFVDAGVPVVIVGDPKQSIYGFRGADVEVFRRASTRLQAGGARALTLRESRRSTPELVAALNRLFADGGVFEAPNHHPSASSARAPGLGLRQRGRALTPVIRLTWPEEAEQAGLPVLRRTWARGIAGLLVELLDGTTLKSNDRPLRPADVFVLTRTAREGRDIAQVLLDAGVPAQLFERDGVLQGREAQSVSALLDALVQPDHSGAAVRAWLTPFFGLEPDQVDRAADLHSGAELLVRLAEWSERAHARAWPQVFEEAMRAAGPRCREGPTRWGDADAYARIFDELLAMARSHGWSPADTAAWMREAVRGEQPSPRAGLEAERDAVRVSTIHAAKGLQAEVVILFGGASARRPSVTPFRSEDGQLRAHLGADLPESAAYAVEQEEQRLLYVGLTRARALAVIPRFITEPPGPVRHLHRGSARLLPEDFEDRPATYREAPRAASEPPAPSARLSWHGRMGPLSTSFSDLKRRQSDDLPGDAPDAPRRPIDLPGGPRVGKLLHAMLELGPWEQMRDPATVASATWVQELFETHGVSNVHAEAAAGLVVRALDRPLALPGGRGAVTLRDLRHVRELDFLLRLDPGRTEVRGFVDLVFEVDGEVYVLDYKSDILPDYGPAALRAHVGHAYALQADIYLEAARRHFARIPGGVVYLFLRAEPDASGGQGVWSRVPDGRELDRVVEAARGHA